MLACVVFQKNPGPPNASVTLLGYTNDTNGIRLARFAITNLGASAVKRLVHYQIQIPSPTGWTVDSAGSILGGRLLGAGASETVTVPAPTNQPSWRISILTYTDPGHTAVSKWEMTVAMLHAVLTPRYRVMLYSIYSNLITEEH